MELVMQDVGMLDRHLLHRMMDAVGEVEWIVIKDDLDHLMMT